MAQALDGIKVIDLARYAPGFYVSMVLGDMGADVIKVEEPEIKGRRAGFKETPLSYRMMEDEQSAPFNALERNKRKIALDLKNEEARKVFYKLVERSDVVLEGARPGVAQRLGVDYETCKKINPRIVYTSLTGFGQDGPYRLLAGHDINYISIGGALGMIGLKDGTPVIPVNLIADFAAGAQNAVIGTLLALMARQRTGKGQFVDISMADGVIGLATMFAQEFFKDGVVPAPSKMRLNGAMPHYNVYQAKDGRWMAMGANEPWFFDTVCKLMGRPDMSEHQNNPDKQDDVFRFLRESFKTKTADEWHEIMTKADTCVTKIYNFDEVFSDPQVLHRKMVIELDRPKGGKARQTGIPIKLSETPGKVRSVAHAKGQDTEAVLLDLGYSKADVAKMREAGAAS